MLDGDLPRIKQGSVELGDLPPGCSRLFILEPDLVCLFWNQTLQLFMEIGTQLGGIHCFGEVAMGGCVIHSWWGHMAMQGETWQLTSSISLWGFAAATRLKNLLVLGVFTHFY